MPQINLALMDAILISLVVFVTINDYLTILEQTMDDISTYNMGILIN